MTRQPMAVERLARIVLRVAFWLPLGACTWLALSPSPPDAVFRLGDVALHALAFTYLTFALGLAYPSVRLLVIVLCMIGYGVFIEAAQSFEPARTAELKDLLVDLAGIVLGIVLLERLGGWSRRLLHACLESFPKQR